MSITLYIGQSRAEGQGRADTLVFSLGVRTYSAMTPRSRMISSVIVRRTLAIRFD
jgi:hypothetical protein